jgi:hypothetical protein
MHTPSRASLLSSSVNADRSLAVQVEDGGSGGPAFAIQPKRRVQHLPQGLAKACRSQKLGGIGSGETNQKGPWLKGFAKGSKTRPLEAL